VKLASEPQRPFTKEELLREVWDFRLLGSKRCLRPTPPERPDDDVRRAVRGSPVEGARSLCRPAIPYAGLPPP
jgi:hypothetical protein